MNQSCPSMDRHRPLGRILTGWIAILLCSLLLYDALLYSSLRTATREGTQASASVAATALKSRMAIGIRFGKKLETYHNVDRLLASVGQAADMPLAVLDARGKALHHWGRFPLLPDISDRLPQTGKETILSLKDGELLLAPIADRDERIVGHIAVWMPSLSLDATLQDLFRQQLLFQGGLALAGILLLSFCLGLRRSGGMPRNLCIAVFLLLMLGNGTLALHAVSRQYTQGLRNDAAHTGAILTEDLNRLLLVGVSLDDASRLSAYLTRAATAHGEDLVLEVLAPSGKVFASSHASGPLPELLPRGEEFPLLELASSFSVSGDSPEQGWKLRASLTRGPWLERLIANGLDILTLVAISLGGDVPAAFPQSGGPPARDDADPRPPQRPVPPADVRFHPGHGHDHLLHPPAHGRTHHVRHAPARRAAGPAHLRRNGHDRPQCAHCRDLDEA